MQIQVLTTLGLGTTVEDDDGEREELEGLAPGDHRGVGLGFGLEVVPAVVRVSYQVSEPRVILQLLLDVHLLQRLYVREHGIYGGGSCC